MRHHFTDGVGIIALALSIIGIIVAIIEICTDSVGSIALDTHDVGIIALALSIISIIVAIICLTHHYL